MKSDFLLEFKRQTVHLFLGMGIAFATYLFYPDYGNLILVPLIISVAIMIVIPRRVSDLRVANHLLYHFERDHDIISFPFKGAIWYGIGVTVPVLFLPTDVITGRPALACAIIAILSAGDSMSTLVGKFAGRHRIGPKSVEGFLAFVVASSFAASLFIPDAVSMAIMLSVLGGFVELFLDQMDDNFLVPVILTISYHIADIIVQNTMF